MQGIDSALLKFCLELSDGTSSPNIPNRDPKDYAWLKEALNNLETDTDKMKKCLEIVKNKDAKFEELEYALQEIQWLAENIDNANDLWKINGITPIADLLNSITNTPNNDPTIVRIKELIIWIFGTISHNNPESQMKAIDYGILNLLVKLMKEETEEKVIAKIIFALSALLSENHQAIDYFLNEQGIESLFVMLANDFNNTTPSNNNTSKNNSSNNNTSTKKIGDSTKMKAIFLLTKLLNFHPLINKKLQEIEFYRYIINFISESTHADLKEKSLQFFIAYLTQNRENVKHIKNKETITEALKELQQQAKKENATEEVHLFETLLNLL